MVVSAPNAACVTVTVQLDQGPTLEVPACPDSSGAAAFALPLFLHGSSGLGQLTVSQPATAGRPGRRWRRLISARTSPRLRIDTEQAEVVPPPSTEAELAPAPPTGPTSTVAAPSIAALATCPCTRRCCTQLEAGVDRSLPAFLALAVPAPTCGPAPRASPAAAPTCGPTSRASPTAAPTIRQARQRLVTGLCTACALQALALAALLLRCSAAQMAAASRTGGRQTAEEAAAPARRSISLRDACTSPLALLASPFVGARAAADGLLDVILEEEEQQEEEEAQARGQGEDLELQPAGIGGLPAPPAGWTRWAASVLLAVLAAMSIVAHPCCTPCRDAWGRLQRQSGGGGGWGGKPAVAHPPPFGSAPGTAYRSFSVRPTPEE